LFNLVIFVYFICLCLGLIHCLFLFYFPPSILSHHFLFLLLSISIMTVSSLPFSLPVYICLLHIHSPSFFTLSLCLLLCQSISTFTISFLMSFLSFLNNFYALLILVYVSTSLFLFLCLYLSVSSFFLFLCYNFIFVSLSSYILFHLSVCSFRASMYLFLSLSRLKCKQQ